MNKNMKRVFGVIIALCIVFCSAFTNAETDSYIIDDRNGNLFDAKGVAERKLAELCEVGPENEFFYADSENYMLAEPFIIYITDQQFQDEIYEFPVYNEKNNEIIYIIDVFSVEKREEYLCELSFGYVDELNDLNYVEHPDSVVLYRIGNVVLIENENGIYDGESNKDLIEKSISEYDIDFLNMSFQEKRAIVSERMANGLRPASFAELDKEYINNALMNGNLTLYNPRLQYGYGMCWACCVATIYNYLYTASITGFDVCNIMSIGYNSGGTIINEKDALNKYGVVYNVIRLAESTNSTMLMSYSNITYNISASYPVILNGHSNTGNHAVTIYGYNGSQSSSNNMSIFDSAYSNITAGKRTYTWSNGYFVSNGTTYEEMSTLSKY